ncbi:MAG TPA: polysaccharide deacetylase family protein [Candidatus Binatia bacterium]|jgi:peptidoglycan/xylan/chitin deacetylase (PgdA/CDA1 family)|nr:polysaccharide deacetylase family protein [Candidatus Binatia bacterium]
MMPLVKRALYHSGLLGLARMARQRVRGVVLRYHALTDGPGDVLYAAPDICMPVAAFRLQMAFVKRAYTVLALDDLVDAVARGGKLPPRTLAITFDDGYADNHRLGMPVLQRLGLPATVYVATGCVDGGPVFWVGAVRALAMSAVGPVLELPGHAPIPLGPPQQRGPAVKALTRALVPLAAPARAELLAMAAAGAGVDLDRLLAGTMLTWNQTRELAAAGWTIGAHTVTHSNVALIDPAEAEAEIMASRDAIAAAVGAQVCHFCYPNTGGQHQYFSPQVVEILKRNGFHSATTSKPGALRPGADPFLLPRLGVSPRLAEVTELAAALERQRLAA